MNFQKFLAETMAKAVQTQLELKTKCEQVQQSLKGLYDWEQEIKQKEAQNRQQQQQQEVEVRDFVFPCFV